MSGAFAPICVAPAREAAASFERGLALLVILKPRQLSKRRGVEFGDDLELSPLARVVEIVDPAHVELDAQLAGVASDGKTGQLARRAVLDERGKRRLDDKIAHESTEQLVGVGRMHGERCIDVERTGLEGPS